MTSLVERNLIIKLIDTAITQGARQSQACAIINLSARTLQRWRGDINGASPLSDVSDVSDVVDATGAPASVLVEHSAVQMTSMEAAAVKTTAIALSTVKPTLTDAGLITDAVSITDAALITHAASTDATIASTNLTLVTAVHHALGDRRQTRIQTPGNRFTEVERQHILTTVNSAPYAHLPPTQIVPILTDLGTYIGSESTIYRVLRAANQLAHRRVEKPAQVRAKPRSLQAHAPNQLYSWDITYLPTAIRGRFYYLYLFLDVFSRHIVGWQVYERERSQDAAEMMVDICRREKIAAGQVVLHSDNGGAMKGSTMLATLHELGVATSFSRPAVSNDNPYSEALFKTCKYRPDYPESCFESLMAARQWVGQFVQWYSHEHRHSAIGFVTPAQRHAGLDGELLAARGKVYEAAKARHPNRWSQHTRQWQRVDVVHLNPTKESEGALSTGRKLSTENNIKKAA